MPRSKAKRTVFPFSIVLTIVGALLLFSNFGFLQLGSVFDVLMNYWPLIVIAMGVGRIISGGSSRFSEGLVMIAVGIILQVAMLGLLSGDLLQMWPVAMVLAGLWMIFVQPKNTVIEKEITDSEIRISETVRGSVITLSSPSFGGGRFSTMFSAVDCDMSQCQPGEKFMKLYCGIKVSRVNMYIPEHWRVVSNLEESAASVEDRRALGNPPENTDAPELQLHGSILLAKLEICDLDALHPEEREET